MSVGMPSADSYNLSLTNQWSMVWSQWTETIALLSSLRSIIE